MAVADGPFRGDRVLEDMERERRDFVASLIRERRVAALDACVGLGGCVIFLVHAYAPWAVLFEFLRVSWIPFALAAVFAAFGIWNVVEAIRLHRWLARLS